MWSSTKFSNSPLSQYHGISWLFVIIFLFTSANEVNQNIFLAINLLANNYLPPAIIAHITDLGNGTVAIAILLLAISNRPEYAIRILILIILVALIVNFAKEYYELPRPVIQLPNTNFHILDTTVTTDGLPSGHTATVFAMAGLVWLSSVNLALKNLMLLVAVMAGLSRIAVGVHWPQDIALGALIGWTVAFLTYKITQTPSDNQILGRLIIIGLALLLVSSEIFIDLPEQEFPNINSIYLVRQILVGLSLVAAIYQVIKILNLPKKFTQLINAFFSIRFIKFGVVGSTGFIVDTSIYFLATQIGLPHLAARAISYWISATNNWFFNRIFTFKDIAHPAKIVQWGKYLTMALGSFLLNWGTYYILTEYFIFFTQYKFIAFILGVGVGIIFNFTIANFIIFKPKPYKQ